MNGKAMPAKFDPPPVQPATMSGVVVGHFRLGDGFLADDGLMQQRVVEAQE